MGLSVTFVSGPRRSGKSALIQAMTYELWRAQPHYIRLVKAGSDKQPPKSACKPAQDTCGVASARWMEYDEDAIFAILPEALSAIHKRDRYGSVVIEADADPTLRCAYPYDHRVFVMPLPPGLRDVFRDTTHAARELRKVLDDTAAFASEIFGLFGRERDEAREPAEERSDFTPTQMRGFLYSPLGDELATRIQLQQPYHGLVESDVIVVNESVGQRGPQTEECLRRIGQLLARLHGAGGRRGEMFICPIAEGDGALDHQLLKALKPMCQGGK